MALRSSLIPTKTPHSRSWLSRGGLPNTFLTKPERATFNMASESISRRDILRTLAVGAAAGSVLQVIPAEAAAFIHQAVRKEKAASAAGNYAPKYFSPGQYATRIALCE